MKRTQTVTYLAMPAPSQVPTKYPVNPSTLFPYTYQNAISHWQAPASMLRSRASSYSLPTKRSSAHSPLLTVYLAWAVTATFQTLNPVPLTTSRTAWAWLNLTVTWSLSLNSRPNRFLATGRATTVCTATLVCLATPLTKRSTIEDLPGLMIVSSL